MDEQTRHRHEEEVNEEVGPGNFGDKLAESVPHSDAHARDVAISEGLQRESVLCVCVTQYEHTCRGRILLYIFVCLYIVV